MPMNLKNAIFGGSVTGISDRSGAYDGSIQAWLPIKDIVQGVVVTRDQTLCQDIRATSRQLLHHVQHG